MATATWFDYNAYMANKLVQVNAIDPKVQYTPETLKAEFEKAGYVGEEGAFKHFEQYGKTEDVAPNALFDADEYITAKAADFFKTDKPTASQIAEVTKAFADGGMSAWDHYVTYGSSEGVEPSFSFNTDAYLAAKAAALNTGKYDGKENWTPEDVAAAIKASGSTVLEHFMANGGGGELEVAVTYKGIAEGGVKNPFIDPTPPTAVPDPGPAATHNLTTGVDYIAPDATDPAFRTTDGDDIIAGKITLNPTTTTVQQFDTVDGGKGNNTFELTMETAVSNALKDMTVSNVQTLKVTATKGALSDDVKGWNGLTSVVIDGVASSTLGLTDKVTQASYQNVSGNITQTSDTKLAALTLTNVAGNVTTASKAAYFTLNVNGVGAEDTSSVIEMGTAASRTIDIAATGDDSFIKFGQTDAKKSTNFLFSGDGNVTVTGTVGTAGSSIDGSAMKGDLDFSEAILGDVNVTFTGGLGNDSITLLTKHTGKISMGDGNDIVTLVTGSMGVGLKIDGGLGTDILETGVLATSGALTTLLGKFGTDIKGFEVLSIVGATTASTGLAADTLTLDFNTLKGIQGVEVAANGTTAWFGADGSKGAAGTTSSAPEIGEDGNDAIKVTNLASDQYVTIASSLTGGVGGTGGAGHTSHAASKGADGGDGGDALSFAGISTIDLRFAMDGALNITGGDGGTGGASAASGSAGATGAGGDGIDASGASSLKITLIGDSTTANTVTIAGGAGKNAGASIRVADNATITLVDSLSSEGNAYSNITFGVTTTAKGVTVDGSALHGKMNVTGTKFADTIKGGEAADTITGGAGANILTGGLGADTFNMTGAVVNTGITTSAADITKADINTITDWNAGEVADKITASSMSILDDSTTLFTGGVLKNGVVTFTNQTNWKTFVQMASNATDTTAGKAVAYYDGNDTYVFISDVTKGFTNGDQIIKLAGHATDQAIGMAAAGDGFTIA